MGYRSCVLALLSCLLATPLAWSADGGNGFRTQIIDHGAYVEQITPLRNFTQYQVRVAAAMSLQVLQDEIELLHKNNILPREMGLDAIKALAQSRNDFQGLIKMIQDQDVNRVARDFGIAPTDLLPGAFFIGLGIAGNLPDSGSLGAFFDKLGASRGSFTIGVVVVPMWIQHIDKVASKENPDRKVTEYINFDYSAVILPNVNIRGIDLSKQAPAEGVKYRPTFGLIWGPGGTGDIYSASQVAGPFGNVSATIGWSSALKWLLSLVTFRATGISGKAGVIWANGYGYLPAVFYGPEYGKTLVGANGHIAFGAVMRLADAFDLLFKPFIPTQQTTTPSPSPSGLQGNVRLLWDPQSHRVDDSPDTPATTINPTLMTPQLPH